ncbi:MAG: cell division control protein 6, partial [Methanoregula sp.]|nr:cell division control protein 6 [Methanoregula sp.]
VEQTLKSGDLRVGIDLLKRAALNAERATRRSIERGDICGAYEVSKYLHLEYTIKTLKDEEKKILAGLARASTSDGGMNAGEVYKTIKETVPVGYTRFYEIIKKMDAMRLVNLQYREGKGRTRVITLRYEPAKVLGYLS